MKRIICGNEKGGVGKTTLALHLAWFFAERGLRVLAIDLDQQQNFSDTLSEYRGDVSARSLFESVVTIPPSPAPVLAYAARDLSDVDQVDETALQNFAESLRVSAKNFDIAIIDTPPALHTLRTISAIYVATHVIAPIDLGQYSLQGVANLLQVLAGVAEHLDRPPIDFLGFLPSRFQRSSPGERKFLEQLAIEAGGALFPNAIPKRDAYLRVAVERKPVWKLPGGRDAGAEMRRVLSEIAQRMGMQSND